MQEDAGEPRSINSARTIGCPLILQQLLILFGLLMYGKVSTRTDCKPLRILLTTNPLEGRPGGSLYVKDFAGQLLKMGHRPVVYSTRLGDLAYELQAMTIPVIDRLE